MNHTLVSILRPLAVVFLLAATLPACRSDAEAVCDDKCDCEGCSNAMYDDCYFDAQDKEVEADRQGCLDYWDDWKACEYDTGYCKSDGHWEASCKNEKERYDNCKK